ncbi:MAG: Nif3-like dinuclear metal center hexameric protein, partial [Desulfobaccales bacterium]
MSELLQDIVNLLESRYPSAWAVTGDRVGLEVGHPGHQVEAILVALEATPAIVAEAGHRGAQLLLTHHPLLYQPLK